MRKCPSCNYETGTIGNLKDHWTRHHSDNRTPFICKFKGCNSKFCTKLARDRHAKQHNKKKRVYKCSQCKFSVGPSVLDKGYALQVRETRVMHLY